MLAYAIELDPAPLRPATIAAFDRSTHVGPTPDDVTPRPLPGLDDAQADVLRQIANGRTCLSLREDDIADELALLDLVVSTRGRRYATRKGCRAVGLRRIVPVPGRHMVAKKAVRRG